MKLVKHLTLFATIALVASCAKKVDDSISSTLPTAPQNPEDVTAANSLYVASGVCNSGTGITTFTQLTSSRVVYKTNLSTGNVDSIIADYNSPTETANSNPTGILNIDNDFIYVLVENATSMGARKLEKINKITKSKTTYFQDSSAFTATAGHVLRNLIMDSNSNLLINKTIAVERLNGAPARLTIGANPYVNNPGGACATNNTLVTAITVMPPFNSQSQGKIIYAHQAAGQNDIGIISRSGYAATSDCLANIPPGASTLSAALGGTAVTIAATAAPTALVYIPVPSAMLISGKLLVAYASSTVNAGTTINNGIVSYDVTESADNTISVNNSTVLYLDNTVIHGISAMTYDSSTQSLYVATAASTASTTVGYNIEKFNYSYISNTLNRVGTTPFQSASLYNKCISAMMIAN